MEQKTGFTSIEQGKETPVDGLAEAQERVDRLRRTIEERNGKPNLLRTAIDQYVRSAQERDRSPEKKE